MKDSKLPILLSFHALTGERSILIRGQLTFTRIKDLSFKDYSRRKTFRTLVSLYRTKQFVNQDIVLFFDKGVLSASTDNFGSFSIKTDVDFPGTELKRVNLSTGEDVKMIGGLYPLTVQQVKSEVIVISDIDDTIMHSFIYRSVKKFRTLMFTTVEKRKAVSSMHTMLQQFHNEGAASFYVSNSEQNLYPLIYRFLIHNDFPPGPLFLKKMRKLWDVIRNVKFPMRNQHKEQTLHEIIQLFPGKKIVLMGDNTQHDIAVYLDAAAKYPESIRSIIILKVIKRNKYDILINEQMEKLKSNNITFHYASAFDTLPDSILNPPNA